MHSSFLFAGILPLVAAEACSSVVAKTHLVTSVVTTVMYTTLEVDPSCSTSFEWKPPAPPTGTDFEWLPEPSQPAEPSGSKPSEPEKPVPSKSGEPECHGCGEFTYTSISTVKPSETPSTSDEPEHPSHSSTVSTKESVPTTSESPSSPVSEKPSSTTESGSKASTTSAEESVTETPTGDEPKPTTTPAESGDATTSSCDESSAVTTKSSEETPATTSSAEKTTDASTSSCDESSAVTTKSSEETPVTTSSAEKTTDASTTCDESSAVTTKSSEETPATTSSAEKTTDASTSSCDESSTVSTKSAEETPATTSDKDSESTTSATETPVSSETKPVSSDVSSAPTSSKEATSSAVTSASETSVSSKVSSKVTTSAAATTSKAESTSKAATTSKATSSTSSAAPEQTKYPRNYPADIVDELQDESMDKLKEWLGKNDSNGCTLEKATVRREWGDLSVEQREDYVNAVLCLQSAESRYKGEVAGAKNRFDDFVVTHQAQTNYIHGTANFLTWHRYFIHEFEKALKNECGYKGVMPYWNWDRYASDPEKSPLFNGDSASLSGNSGRSGCVETGPFKDMTVNLGPGSSTRHNPRCLRREISKTAARYTKVDISYPLITQSNNVGQFQDRIQSGNNVHAAGHHTVGGNPGADIYTSPGDPYFHLHHAGVDRLFWIWQLQNLDSRLHEVSGQNTFLRKAGSLTEKMNLGKNAGDVELQSLLNTMGGLNGELCYIYY